MATNQNEQRISEQILHRTRPHLGEREKKVAHHLHERIPISRNTAQEYDTQLTFGQRIADHVAAFGGSWPFIILFGAVLVAWIVLNAFLLIKMGSTFDPYPYILLPRIVHACCYSSPRHHDVPKPTFRKRPSQRTA